MGKTQPIVAVAAHTHPPGAKDTHWAHKHQTIALRGQQRNTTMTGRILVAIALLVAAVVAVASAVPTEPHMAGEFGVELDDWPLLPNLHGLKSEEEERVFYARVGPFTIQPKKTFDGQPMMIRPLPDELIEISHWGDWEHEYEDGSIVPNSKIYHHHNFCYMSGGSSGFMTGLSNERNTWGPNNLHTVDQRDEETGEVIAYRVPLNPGATVKCNFHTWQTVCHPMVTLHAGETLEFNAIYDDSCGWHGVMSWWFYFAWPVGGQILD